MNQYEMDRLEDLVDQCGMDSVIAALAEIAGGKAQHLADNWQDYNGSRAWAKVSSKLAALSCSDKIAAVTIAR